MGTELGKLIDINDGKIDGAIVGNTIDGTLLSAIAGSGERLAVGRVMGFKVVDGGKVDG